MILKCRNLCASIRVFSIIDISIFLRDTSVNNFFIDIDAYTPTGGGVYKDGPEIGVARPQNFLYAPVIV